MMSRFLSWHIDFLGFSVSFLCAIHCLLIPVFLTVGVLQSDSIFSHKLVEYIVVPASLLIAAWALYRAFQKHRNATPLILAFTGFITIMVSYLLNQGYFHYLVGLGGLCIAIAHFYNWKLSHKVAKK